MKVRVEMTFPGELKNEPVFYEMIKNFDIVPIIVEASFSTKTGWAYVKLEGAEDEINRLFDYLTSKNVIIDKRS